MILEGRSHAHGTAENNSHQIPDCRLPVHPMFWVSNATPCQLTTLCHELHACFSPHAHCSSELLEFVRGSSHTVMQGCCSCSTPPSHDHPFTELGSSRKNLCFRFHRQPSELKTGVRQSLPIRLTGTLPFHVRAQNPPKELQKNCYTSTPLNLPAQLPLPPSRTTNNQR